MILPADPSNSTVHVRYAQLEEDFEHADSATARGLPSAVVAEAWKQVAVQAMGLIDDLLFEHPVTPTS